MESKNKGIEVWSEGHYQVALRWDSDIGLSALRSYAFIDSTLLEKGPRVLNGDDISVLSIYPNH